MLSYYTVYSYS